MLIDPTHDFGKNTWHGLELLRRLDELVEHRLAGADGVVQQGLHRRDARCGELADRVDGTLAATSVAAMAGARVFRAHEVGQNQEGGRDGGEHPGHPPASPMPAGAGVMHADARAWFAERTWQSPSWTVEELLRAKGSRTVSVVLPALNEEATVADVIASVRPLVGTLVDELVVVDSGSTDRTVEVSLAAGARVVRRGEVLPELEPVPGKGEVLWRSLAATTGDLLVFLDSDLIDPDPEFVPRLLGPMLLEPDVHLVKGFYRRPLTSEGAAGSGGGRVTELMAGRCCPRCDPS